MNIIVMPLGLLGTNCYVVASEKGNCAVIDPGAQGAKIIDLLEKNNYTPQYILLTHGHYDHVGGVKKLLERYPGAQLYIGEQDVELLSDTSKSYSSPHYESVGAAALEQVKAADQETQLTVDELTFGVVETPGHTRGGVVYLCGNTMFSGDTLFYEDVGRTDLYGGDYGVLKTSLKKLADLPGDYTVYPGHGESSTLEHERRFNRYLAE